MNHPHADEAGTLNVVFDYGCMDDAALYDGDFVSPGTPPDEMDLETDGNADYVLEVLPIFGALSSPHLPVLRAVGFSYQMVRDVINSQEGNEKLALIALLHHRLLVESMMTVEEIMSMACVTCPSLTDLKLAFVIEMASHEMMRNGFTLDAIESLITVADTPSLASLCHYWADCVALGLSHRDIEDLLYITYDFNFLILHQSRHYLEPLLRNGLFTHDDLINIIVQRDGDIKLGHFMREWSFCLEKFHRFPKRTRWEEGTLMEIIAMPNGRALLESKLDSSATSLPFTTRIITRSVSARGAQQVGYKI